MPSPDFDLIDRVFGALADREEAEGPDSITDIERPVLLIWHAEGIIGNGGFRYFFECRLPLRATADAYDRLGINSAAAILRRLLDLFPQQHVPDDWDERMELFDRLAADHADLISDWETEYYAAEQLAFQQLAGWIRVHDDVFHTPSRSGGAKPGS